MLLSFYLVVTQYQSLRLLIDTLAEKLIAARTTIKDSAEKQGLKNQVLLLFKMRSVLKHVDRRV